MRFNFLSMVVSTTLFAFSHAQGVLNAENPFTAPVGDGTTLIAGQPYNIAWKADTPGTISLVLMKGPATNLLVVKTIADHIPNTGTFNWTPDVSLEGLQTMAAGDGYGFKIVNDATQNFDWSGHWQLQNAQSTFNSAASSSVTSSTVSAVSSTSSSSSSSSVAPSSVSSATSSVESTTTSSASTTETTSVASTSSSSSSSVASSSTPTSSTAPATTSSAPTTESSSTTSSTTSSSTPTTTSSTPATTTSSSATGSSSTSPTVSLSTASSSPTQAASSSSATSSSNPPSPVTSHKISSYAIAGICVGVIAVLAGLLVGFFCVRHRSQAKRESVMFGTKTPGAYDAEFAMMERRQRDSGGFLNSGYNRMSSGRDFREIGQASSTF